MGTSPLKATVTGVEVGTQGLLALNPAGTGERKQRAFRLGIMLMEGRLSSELMACRFTLLSPLSVASPPVVGKFESTGYTSLKSLLERSH